MERQGFGIRLGALLIDMVILLLLGLILNVIFGRGFTFSFRSGGVAGTVIYILVCSAVELAYWSTEIFRAASAGKMILGLTIAGESGVLPTQNRLVMRWAIKHSAVVFIAASPIIGGISGILAGLAALTVFVGCFMALGAARQALHDVLAHTAVFKTAPALIQAVRPPPPPL